MTMDLTGAKDVTAGLLRPPSGVYAVKPTTGELYVSENNNDRITLQTKVVNDPHEGLGISLNLGIPNAQMADWLRDRCRDEIVAYCGQAGIDTKALTKEKFLAGLLKDDVVLYVVYVRGDAVGARDKVNPASRAIWEAYRKNPATVRLPAVQKPKTSATASARAGATTDDIPF